MIYSWFVVGIRIYLNMIFLGGGICFIFFLGDMNSKQILCLGGCLGLPASNSSRPFLGIRVLLF